MCRTRPRTSLCGHMRTVVWGVSDHQLPTDNLNNGGFTYCGFCPIKWTAVEANHHAMLASLKTKRL